VVLIGPATAGRKWINYEINKAWTDNKGVVGIHIHNLKDRFGNQSAKGANPFHMFMIDGGVPARFGGGGGSPACTASERSRQKARFQGLSAG
jgi:hypothetical protein